MELSLRAHRRRRGRCVGRGCRSRPPAARYRPCAAAPSARPSSTCPRRRSSLITCGRRSYRIHTYPAEDFPHLPDSRAPRCDPIDREALLDTIARVEPVRLPRREPPCARPGFSSLRAGKIVMAATDSYRLAVKETPPQRLGADVSRRSSRPRALQELARIARVGRGGRARQCTKTTSSSASAARGSTTRRIDGQFPNYRQLLPERFEHELELPRRELLDVVRRVGLLAQRNSPLRLRFAEGELTRLGRRPRTSERHASRSRRPTLSRAAGDRLQRGVSARRTRLDRLVDRQGEADQPASPRGLAGRDRRLHLPDHADPSRGLSPPPSDRPRQPPELPLVRVSRPRRSAGS